MISAARLIFQIGVLLPEGVNRDKSSEIEYKRLGGLLREKEKVGVMTLKKETAAELATSDTRGVKNVDHPSERHSLRFSMLSHSLHE